MERNFETVMIEQCAPVLASLKPAGLFRYETRDCADLARRVRSWNEQLASKGLSVRVLKIEGRARGAEYVKRVVECYDEALRAIDAGTYTPELAAGLKERLATVFNRGFWEGYYAGRPVAEHSEHYGSAATRRKVYVGKVTNFYKRISVAEVLVEAAALAVGEVIFFMGATTGVAEQTLAELHDTDGKPVPSVAQGTLCAVRTQGTIRRGDQLYKFVDAQ